MDRRWLFADQLGPHFLDAEHQPVLIVESRAALRRRPVHRRRAHLVLSALRHRAAELGDQAVLIQTSSYREAIEQLDENLTLCAPTSWRPVTSSAPCLGHGAASPRVRDQRGGVRHLGGAAGTAQAAAGGLLP